jgi:hypothetical protein
VLETNADTTAYTATKAAAAAADPDAYAGTRRVIPGAISIRRCYAVATIVRLGSNTARNPDR